MAPANKMKFSWKEPQLLLPSWTGDSPLPVAHDQSLYDLCIPWGTHTWWTASQIVLAWENGKDAPPLMSRDYILDAFCSFPNNKKTIHRLLQFLSTKGCVAVEDYRYHRVCDPEAQVYHIDYKANLSSDDFTLTEFNEKVENRLHQHPLLCEIVATEQYGDDVLYQPLLSDLENVTEGHAITLTGYGNSLVRGNREKKVWEYLNSWGPNWGRKGYGEVLQGRLQHVYGASALPWWE